ncbi:MAG: hypothetical protein V1681_05305 [Candidatus Neomarinimicrobiota bacterium]
MVAGPENNDQPARDAELIRKIRSRVAEVQELVDEMKSRLTEKE